MKNQHNEQPNENVQQQQSETAEIEPVFLRYNQLIQLIGSPVHKTTLWRWEKKGTFPKRIKLGDKTVVWDQAEVDKWQGAKRSRIQPLPVPSEANR